MSVRSCFGVAKVQILKLVVDRIVMVGIKIILKEGKRIKLKN